MQRLYDTETRGRPTVIEAVTATFLLDIDENGDDPHSFLNAQGLNVSKIQAERIDKSKKPKPKSGSKEQ